MTEHQRAELQDFLTFLRAEREALETLTFSEPADSPCEDEAIEWGEDTPEPATGWLDF
jgi:hypothetical protein